MMMMVSFSVFAIVFIVILIFIIRKYRNKETAEPEGGVEATPTEEETLALVEETLALEEAPTPPPTLAPASCNFYGYANCADDEFNVGYDPPAIPVINERIAFDPRSSNFDAAQHCCKKSNISGDSRPEAIKVAGGALKFWNAMGIILSIFGGFTIGGFLMGSLTRLFSIPGTAAASGNGVTAGVVISAIMVSAGIETVLIEGLDGVIREQMADGPPMRDCYNPPDQVYKSENGIEVVEYEVEAVVNEETNETTKVPQKMLVQTKNGCPLLYNTPQLVKYGGQVANAIKDANLYYEIVKGDAFAMDKLNEAMVKFDNFDEWKGGIVCRHDPEQCGEWDPSALGQGCPCDIGCGGSTDESTTGDCNKCTGGEMKWKCWQDEIKSVGY